MSRQHVAAGDCDGSWRPWPRSAWPRPSWGRPKTDRVEAVWLCKVAERQMLRPSFVPPPAFRQLRNLTRYPVDLLAVRTSEEQRVDELLEDALIKLSVVVRTSVDVSRR